ncbi:hypothetical protein DRJ25_01285 [Candidatus Woesearchaeota archaeon]|nr:MAG: hypothetical protein DRJ25_01285 [Candidatus Woesearchaeota archaeon]
MDTQKYHKILVPTPDVYSLSGAEVFKHLERKDDNDKNLVVVPSQFIEEMEIKTRSNSYSAGAEDVLRFLKETIKKSTILKRTEEETTLVSEVFAGLDILFIQTKANKELSIESLESKINSDNRLQAKEKILITNDPAKHILYHGKGLKIEDPQFLQVKEDIVNEGIIDGNDDLYEELQQKSSDGVQLDEATELLDRQLYINQFIRFRAQNSYQYARVTAQLERNKSGSRIISTKNEKVKLLSPQEYKKKIAISRHYMNDILGIKPRDMEQYIALEYGLMNKNVELFFLCGAQGSGKTLLAYVAAIDQILHYDKEIREKRGSAPDKKSGFFEKIVLLKPTEIFGGKRRDIGALPGNLYQKLKPHLGSYLDAHRESSLSKLFPFEELLLHPKFENDFGGPRSENLKELKIRGEAFLPNNTEAIEMTYSGHVRGRSFRNTLILVDEAQNFTPYELKTIIERTGEGCKIVLMGDPAQVDNPFCSREINGLTHAIKQYIDKPYSALVTLTRNYRSQMSEDAKSWRVFSQ